MENIKKDDRDFLDFFAKQRARHERRFKPITGTPKLVKRKDATPKPQIPSDDELRRAVRLWKEDRETLENVDLGDLVDDEPKIEFANEPE